MLDNASEYITETVNTTIIICISYSVESLIM